MPETNADTQKAYEPELSGGLKKFLQEHGTLQDFQNDYRQLCTNFKGGLKPYIKGKEQPPKKYEKMTPSEKETLSKLGKSYAHALHHLLELGFKIQAHEKQKKEKINYAVIGGMGVLAHLYRHNPKFVQKWRGTEDIDLLAEKDLRKFYQKMGMEKHREDNSQVHLDTYKKENPHHDQPLKIQQRKEIKLRTGKMDESKNVYAKKETIELYGVPIKVASKTDLIDTKTGIRRRTDKLSHFKDDHDKLHLENIILLERKNREK